MTALHTTLTALATLTGQLRGRLGRGRDRGSSALEFAIIAAIVVIAASVIGAVVYNIVDTKSQQLNDCANQPIGSAACAP